MRTYAIVTYCLAALAVWGSLARWGFWADQRRRQRRLYAPIAARFEALAIVIGERLTPAMQRLGMSVQQATAAFQKLADAMQNEARP